MPKERIKKRGSESTSSLIKTASNSAVKIFISYSTHDEWLEQALKTHLTLLQTSGMVQIWPDFMPQGGIDWGKEIRSGIDNADIILLLLSADYFVSSYCQKEMKRALERAKTGKAKIIPIILRSVDWKVSSVGTLQALPTGAKPVTRWADTDAVWADVARGVREAVESLRKTSNMDN